MSRSKSSRQQTPEPSARKADFEKRRRVWLLIAGGVASAAVLLFSALQIPFVCFQMARGLLPLSPSWCEAIVDRAIVKAGGDYPAAQLLQCQALAALGEWDTALGGFTLIKNPARCSPVTLVELGASALKADQLQLADRALQVARVPGPTYQKATELLISSKLLLHQEEKALELCREWISVLPKDALPWAISARIESSRLNLGAAISEFQEALERTPTREMENALRVSLARLLVHTGDAASARIQFETLLKMGPLNSTSQLDYIHLLRMEGRTDEALHEIQQYLAHGGPRAEALKQKALIEIDQGLMTEALADLKFAAADDEFDVVIQQLLARVYLSQEQPDLAQSHLERSRHLLDPASRIKKLDELLISDPENAEWRRERDALRKVIIR